MNITKTYLKQLIREELLKETNRADLEFLRDVAYSESVDSETFLKIASIYEDAKSKSDAVTTEYIESMSNILKDPYGMPYTASDIKLVNDFFDDFADLDWAELPDQLDRRDFAYFIKSARWFSWGVTRESERLWPLVHHHWEKGEKQRWGQDPPFDLEP